MTPTATAPTRNPRRRLAGLLAVSTYNPRFRFTNGVRWARLGVGCRGLGVWEQRTDKALGRQPQWEWPLRPFLPLWCSRRRRLAVMLPLIGRQR